ncbi:MAG: hypothetical protein ACK5QX_10530, partial [bacterium]
PECSSACFSSLGRRFSSPWCTRGCVGIRGLFAAVTQYRETAATSPFPQPSLDGFEPLTTSRSPDCTGLLRSAGPNPRSAEGSIRHPAGSSSPCRECALGFFNPGERHDPHPDLCRHFGCFPGTSRHRAPRCATAAFGGLQAAHPDGALAHLVRDLQPERGRAGPAPA